MLLLHMLIQERTFQLRGLFREWGIKKNKQFASPPTTNTAPVAQGILGKRNAGLMEGPASPRSVASSGRSPPEYTLCDVQSVKKRKLQQAAGETSGKEFHRTFTPYPNILMNDIHTPSGCDEGDHGANVAYDEGDSSDDNDDSEDNSPFEDQARITQPHISESSKEVVNDCDQSEVSSQKRGSLSASTASRVLGSGTSKHTSLSSSRAVPHAEDDCTSFTRAKTPDKWRTSSDPQPFQSSQPEASTTRKEGIALEQRCWSLDVESQQKSGTYLWINAADTSEDYTHSQKITIRRAADFLFVCGLREDAFTLYLLLWKQSKVDGCSDGYTEADDCFIQCIRCMTLKGHCIIMQNVVKDQMEATKGVLQAPVPDWASERHDWLERQVAKTKYCLLLLASARIEFALGSGEDSVMGTLKSAYERLNNLEHITAFDFATISPPILSVEIAGAQMYAALVEELILAGDLDINRLVNPQQNTSIASSIRRKKPVSPATPAWPLDFVSYSMCTAPKGTAGDMQAILKQLENLVSSETNIDKRKAPHPSLEPEVASSLFCHMWLAWLKSQTPAIEQQQKRPITVEVLAVLVSLLLAYDVVGEGASHDLDFESQKENFLNQVRGLRTYGYYVAPTETFMKRVQIQYNSMLRRRILRQNDPSPEAQVNLRSFVQETLRIRLPAVLTESSDLDNDICKRYSAMSWGPTLRNSLQTSEDSSYRRFCRKSMRSLSTYRLSVPSAMKRLTESDTSNWLTTIARLSASTRSMSIEGHDKPHDVSQSRPDSQHDHGGG